MNSVTPARPTFVYKWVPTLRDRLVKKNESKGGPLGLKDYIIRNCIFILLESVYLYYNDIVSYWGSSVCTAVPFWTSVRRTHQNTLATRIREHIYNITMGFKKDIIFKHLLCHNKDPKEL